MKKLSLSTQTPTPIFATNSYRPQLLHTYSRALQQHLCKISAQSEPIQQSYDQNAFTIVFLKETMTFLPQAKTYSKTCLCERILRFQGGVFLKPLILVLEGGLIILKLDFLRFFRKKSSFNMITLPSKASMSAFGNTPT